VGTDLRIETTGEEAPGIFIAGTAALTGGTVRTRGPGAPALSVSGSLQMGKTAVVALRSGALALGPGKVNLTDVTLVAGDGPGILWDAGVGPSGGTAAISGGSLASGGGPLFQANRKGCALALRGVLLARGSSPLIQVANDASLNVRASAQVLEGPVLVGTGGHLSLDLSEGSVWTGNTDPDPLSGTSDLSLSADSSWNLTDDSWVEVLKVVGATGGLGVLHSGGHLVHYRLSANPWLGGRTWPLEGGGSLVPY
jgi:hypothetical protein